MPITRRQFDLGIDAQVETWMRTIYDFLAANNNLAYSEREVAAALALKLLQTVNVDDQEFSTALSKLVEIGAIEQRTIEKTAYYGFSQEYDRKTWEPTIVGIKHTTLEQRRH